MEQALTLVYTPGNDSQSQVAMQLFEEQPLQLFYTGAAGRMANLGAGQTVSRDNNPETGELFWSGWLPNEASYYIQLSNPTSMPIDYWLMTGDIRGLPLGATAALSISPPGAPTPAVATGSSPGQAITLNIGQNQGQLRPAQEIWYRFTLTGTDGEFFSEAALTMVVTPNSSGQIGRVEFDLFTGREVETWLAGHAGQLNNIGAGSLVRWDGNPMTGERFWTGWLIDGELYYVRVRNGADGPIDYWLFTGNVYNPRLGSETQ